MNQSTQTTDVKSAAPTGLTAIIVFRPSIEVFLVPTAKVSAELKSELEKSQLFGPKPERTAYLRAFLADHKTTAFPYGPTDETFAAYVPTALGDVLPPVVKSVDTAVQPNKRVAPASKKTGPRTKKSKS